MIETKYTPDMEKFSRIKIVDFWRSVEMLQYWMVTDCLMTYLFMCEILENFPKVNQSICPTHRLIWTVIISPHKFCYGWYIDPEGQLTQS